MALFGIARVCQGSRRRIIASAIEHKSVLVPCDRLRKQGFELVVLPVDAHGVISLDAAKAEIDGSTALVSVQLANNEVGTIQPIAALASYAREWGALVHCDAAQAVGKIEVDVDALGVDFLSISAHKLYGPKGTGALYIRKSPAVPQIEPLAYGGGQEYGLRPGTLNVPGIVGFGEACRICEESLAVESARIRALRDELEDLITQRISDIQINAKGTERLPNTSSITIFGVDAESLAINLENVALSTSSACHSGAIEPSHVLAALGLSRQNARSTIRIGLGRFTKPGDVDTACSDISRACTELRRIAQP